MPYFISLENISPGVRHDGLAWTQAQIQESGSPVGPFTTIQTVALTPLDADPANPQPRDFSSALATLPEGWYRITFLDAVGTLQTSDVVYLPGGFMPTVAEVGGLLRARTKDASGNELGTFTAATRPTAAQVEALIAQASGDVVGRAGATIPEAAQPLARRLVAIRTAMLIELSFFPEQATEANSAFALLERLYDQGVITLSDTAVVARPDRGVVSVPIRGEPAVDPLTDPYLLL